MSSNDDSSQKKPADVWVFSGQQASSSSNGASALSGVTSLQIGNKVTHPSYTGEFTVTSGPDRFGKYEIEQTYGSGTLVSMQVFKDEVTLVPTLPVPQAFDYAWSYAGEYQSKREERKREGRCEECGALLPMSIHGLGECPSHPKPLPPNFKQ